MSTTATDVRGIDKWHHDEAMEIARTEYQRMSDLLKTLRDRDWDRPTDCSLWSVKDIVNHIVGINEAVLSPREMMRQVRLGKPYRSELGLSRFDAGNEVPVRERRARTADEVRASYDDIVPRIFRRRTRMPRAFHALRMPDGIGGWFRFGYLLDVILTRDIWMHRVDISRATGRDMELTQEHDERIVANVVRDWSDKHKKPFSLVLTGPAGGRYVSGSGGEELTVDAVEFCRMLSGRAEGNGLLGMFIPF